MFATLYLVATGAGTARRLPELLPELIPLTTQVLTVLTPNTTRIVSPRELALVPGHRLVASYFDSAILPRPPEGVVLVAPCDFNSLNKLASGIADNLALSITTEAIGRKTPVIVALSCNTPLWNHPRARQSADTLASWGCVVLEPVAGIHGHTMVDTAAIVRAVASALAV